MLAVFFAVSFLPVIPAMAANSGAIEGTDITWTIDADTKTLTIGGEGEVPGMGTYRWDSVLNGSDVEVETLVIEGSIASVADNAFYHNVRLKKLIICEGVESVGENAFRDIGLSSITLPATLKSIGEYAFSHNNELSEVTIPEGITTIGNGMFAGSNELKSITIPNTVTSIGDKAFDSCRQLKSITIPGGVTSIGDNAFSNCDQLGSVIMPKSVKSIGEDAFSYAGSSEGVNIYYEGTEEDWNNIEKTSLTDMWSVEVNVLYESTGITWTFDNGTLTISGKGGMGNFSFGTQPWANATNFGENVTAVIIEDGITSIGSNVFSSYTNLESVTIPDSVTSIGERAFSSCKKLQSITIPEGVTSIGASAFYNSGLQNITIPGSVKSIGTNAFERCYMNEVIISEGVTSIGEGAFQYGMVTTLTLPSTLESIGSGAFQGCTMLNVYYNGSWDDIDIADGNSSLTNITPKSKTITLTYDAGLGTNAPDAQSAKVKEIFTVSDVVPTRAGYNFHGWTDVKNGREVKYHAGDTIEAINDITLYAVWDADFVFSIPSENLSPKIYDTVSIPVSVSDNRGFATLTLSLNYDADKFTFEGVDKTALTSGADITTSGTSIMIVSPSNIKGDGEIVTIKLTAKIDALNTTSDITVTPTQARSTVNVDYDLGIDVGNTTQKAVFSVNGDASGNGTVDSGDVLVMSRYCAKYENHGMRSDINADVYTDGVINIKDIYVLSQYLVTRPQTSSISPLSEQVSPLSADKPEIYGTVSKDGNYVDVTVSVKDNTGFTGFDFALGFDKTKLTPVSITNGSLTSNALVSNINEDGADLSTLDKVTAVWNSTTAVTGNGALYTVRFEVTGDISDSDVIAFERDGFINGVSDINALFPSGITIGGENIAEEFDIVFDNNIVKVTGNARGQFIVAGYDESGRLVKANLVQGYEQPVTEFAGCKTVSAFLWESVSDMKPVCPGKSITQ